VRLVNPVLNFFRLEGAESSNIIAKEGLYDSKAQAMELRTDVTVSTDDGYVCETTHARILASDKTVEGDEPIFCTGGFGQVRGDKYQILDSYSHVDADKIEYKGELTILTGQVQVVQAGTRILADQMKLFRSRLPGGQLGDVTRIEADGDFYYISPEQKVSGKRGVYEQQTNRITVTGDVILGDNTGNVGTTEKFVYDLSTKNAVLEGTCKGRACKSGRPSLIIDTGNRN